MPGAGWTSLPMAGGRSAQGAAPPAVRRAASGLALLGPWLAGFLLLAAVLALAGAMVTWGARAGYGPAAVRPLLRLTQYTYGQQLAFYRQRAPWWLDQEPITIKGRRIQVQAPATAAAAAYEVAQEAQYRLPAVEALLFGTSGGAPAQGPGLYGEQDLPAALLHLHEDINPFVGAAAVVQGPMPGGVYHRGHIHLALGPGAMPVVHELAHWVLDAYTLGNYPTWFSEGLAQWVDEKLTGAPPPGAWDEPYTLYQLERNFDGLPDPGRAYRQGLQLVHCIAAAAGDDMQPLLAELARGVPFYSALAGTTGLTRTDLDQCLSRRSI